MFAPIHEPGTKSLENYRAVAIAGAKRAIAELERRKIQVLITGSLAENNFRLHSDIDFLIVECPRNMKYALEGIIEDALGNIPFDVVYLDEVAPHKLRSFTENARRVEELDQP